MNVVRIVFTLGLVAAVAVGSSACRSSKEKTYNFDPEAHQRAVELKSEALGLVAISGEPYGRHAESVQATNTKLEQAYELSAAAADNEAIAAEWAAMKDSGRDLYAGFVNRWRAASRIDEASRQAATGRLTARFDYILCLEAAKRTKAGRCTSPDAAPDSAASPATAEEASPPA